MSKTLGGSLFCYRGLQNDYCVGEAIESLKAACDEVSLLTFDTDDGTHELVKSFEDSKTKVVVLPEQEWLVMRGKEKLSHFTNICKSFLQTDWHFNLQADEILSEDSHKWLREAIERDEEGYLITRYNLWGDSQHVLNVSHEKAPCGSKIVRLAKTKYFSADDAESLFCGAAAWDYIGKIKIWHMGFVRSKYVHTKKIEHMLTKVFGMGMDEKVTAMNGVFDPFVNFSREDIVPIPEPLPTYVEKWAKSRDELNDFKISFSV